MTKKFNPKNSTCIVTGGSSGIGHALCVELAERGARNIINFDINEGSFDCDYYKIDVSDTNELVETINYVKDQYGDIDLYCSNAGVVSMDNHEDHLVLWKQMMDINFYPSVVAMQTCFPDMIEDKHGHFLITSSAAGLLTMPGSGTYTVTKHALRALAEWMAVSYTSQGIGIHILCPQGVESAMTLRDHPYNTQLGKGNIHGKMMKSSEVSAITLDMMEQGKFMISTHDAVQDYVEHKARDIEDWIHSGKEMHDTFIQQLFTKKVD